MSSQVRPKSLGIDLKLIKLLKIYHGQKNRKAKDGGKKQQNSRRGSRDINYKRCFLKEQNTLKSNSDNGNLIALHSSP